MSYKHLLLGIGLTVIMIGLVIEDFLRYQFWINKPPLSPGPVLIATAGLTVFVPIGIVILIIGAVQK